MQSSPRVWLGRLLGTAAALAVLCFQGPPFVENLRPPRTVIYDFFQEWASARNHFEGLPVYSDQNVTVVHYLGYHPRPGDQPMLQYNGHPPTSVALVAPLAGLDYPEAFLAWALVCLAALGLSVAIVVRQFPLGLTAWSVLPLTALLFLCNPFRQHLNQGQLNLVLLLLLTTAWAVDRSGWPAAAGVCVGTATALKLFPGFVFVYFLARRQVRPVVAGVATFVVLTGLTVGFLGPEAYGDYITVALPALEKYRVWWPNLSLAGFWHKLFNSAGSHVIPLWQNPALAWAGTLLSDLAVTGLAAWAAWRSRSRPACDLAFALVVEAMLLVSPITWDHYFTILFLPLFLLWHALKALGRPGLPFWILLAALWLSPLFYWRLFIPGVTIVDWHDRVATPPQTLTALSAQTYSLLLLFAYTLLLWQVQRRRPVELVGVAPAG
jgi:hypothetical protein